MVKKFKVAAGLAAASAAAMLMSTPALASTSTAVQGARASTSASATYTHDYGKAGDACWSYYFSSWHPYECGYYDYFFKHHFFNRGYRFRVRGFHFPGSFFDSSDLHVRDHGGGPSYDYGHHH